MARRQVRVAVVAAMVSVVAGVLRDLGRIRLLGVHVARRCGSARGECCRGEQADTQEWDQFSKHVNPPHGGAMKDL